MSSLNRPARVSHLLGGGALVLGLLSWLAPGRAVAQDLGALQDRLAIAEQLAQYSYRWDSKDSEGFADLFTADGAMDRIFDPDSDSSPCKSRNPAPGICPRS